MSTLSMNPFIVAVPVESNPKETLKELKETVSTSQKICGMYHFITAVSIRISHLYVHSLDTYEFKMPHLKVTSLEQLIV